MKLKEQKAITLIALVITIIVLIILSAVSLGVLMGDDGLITQARWSSFVTEMTTVKEKIVLKENEKLVQDYYENPQNVTAGLFTNTYTDSISATLQREIEFLECDSNNLYWIEGLDGVKQNTYIYEPTKKIVFKVEGINIFGTTIHSVEYKNSNGSLENPVEEVKTVDMTPEYTNGYYEPNLNGFDAKNTYVIYYSTNYTKTKEVPVQQYLDGGRQRTLEEEGETYTFYNYIDTSEASGTSTWGNVKTYANGQEAWWVWIPRYSYNTTISTTKGFDIKFTTVENKILNLEGQEVGVVGEEDFANYIPHSGFTEKYTDAEGNVKTVKELTGIWMSKYEPSETATPAESQTEAICYAPNMVGYEVDNTYIVTYDKEGNEVKSQLKLSEVLKKGYTVDEKGVLVSGEVDLAKIPSGEVWYDYGNQIWGNIVTKANGFEAWWVWIPRYSYNLEGSATGFGIVFVDLNDNPFEEINDPLDMYEIHPGFNVTEQDGTTKKLKGIWMSKYEPSETNTGATRLDSTPCYAPNMEGFDVDNTFVITYNEDGSEVVGQHKLRTVLKDDAEIEGGVLVSGEVDLAKIPSGEIWYDYGNQIWGNVKTYANNLEAWWVWIPRYSYCLEGSATGFGIVFVDLNDEPFEEINDPLGMYEIHPGFNLKDGTKLKGIWMSKYEPSGNYTNDEIKTPDIEIPETEAETQ